MKKKYILPAAIVAAFILDFVIGRFILSSTNAETNYTTLTMFLTFLFSSTFYIFLLVFFREHKLLVIYSLVALLTSFSFAGYVSLNQYYAFDTILIRLYAGTSYFLGFINVLVAISIILKETYVKAVSVPLLYYAIITFLFGTLITDYIRGYVGSFFGPYPPDLVIVFLVYDIILIVLRLSVAILQGYAIYSLVSIKQGGPNVYKRLVL